MSHREVCNIPDCWTCTTLEHSRTPTPTHTVEEDDLENLLACDEEYVHMLPPMRAENAEQHDLYNNYYEGCQSCLYMRVEHDKRVYEMQQDGQEMPPEQPPDLIEYSDMLKEMAEQEKTLKAIHEAAVAQLKDEATVKEEEERDRAYLEGAARILSVMIPNNTEPCIEAMAQSWYGSPWHPGSWDTDVMFNSDF